MFKLFGGKEDVAGLVANAEMADSGDGGKHRLQALPVDEGDVELFLLQRRPGDDDLHSESPLILRGNLPEGLLVEIEGTVLPGKQGSGRPLLLPEGAALLVIADDLPG